VTISNATHRTEFTYDGLDRRTRIVEKENGLTVADHRYLWSGLELCEERDSTGASTLKRFSSFGVSSLAGADLPAGNYFFTRDHLASVREMTDSAGAVRGRFDYTAYGSRVRLGGDLEPGFGFTGHPLHLPSSLYLAPLRAYDPRVARWISRDPLGESHGANLYEYVSGDPITFLDPLGADGTRADGLVKGTRGFTQAQEGLTAYNNAKSLGKTLEQITGSGAKATAHAAVEDMGNEAVKQIAPGAKKEAERLIDESQKTGNEAVAPTGNRIANLYKTAGDAAMGRDCKPVAPKTPPVQPEKPDTDHWYSGLTGLFGSGPPPPAPPPRDGKITPTPLNQMKLQSQAVPAY
jgi:RHS repeat-associated protein